MCSMLARALASALCFAGLGQGLRRRRAQDRTKTAATGDECLTCLEYGGGAGCLDRCSGKNSECRACIEYGGGVGCIPRCVSGSVGSLYTWGAAAIHKGGNLPNPLMSDGCWSGLRAVNIRTGTSTGVWDSDIVSGVANIAGYWHAKQPTARLSNASEKFDYPCGQEGPRPVVGKVSLHGADVYESNAYLLSGEARTLTQYFVTASYKVASEAADYTRNSGYKLVGSSEWDAKETHLFQHPSSLNCVLSLQGTTSERVLDWWDNIRFYDVNFCGLGDVVHGGFRDQLRAVVDNQSFKTNIQSKLPMCNELAVVGHSLGGALAALYSYCLNAGASGGQDNDRVRFTKLASPALIAPLF